jgi:hypothetical protein
MLFFDMYRLLKKLILFRTTLDYVGGRSMNVNNRRLGKVALSAVPESKRRQLIGEVRNILRRRVVEDKMWRWLLELDNLTINGHVVFGEKKQPNKTQTRKRKRK